MVSMLLTSAEEAVPMIRFLLNEMAYTWVTHKVKSKQMESGWVQTHNQQELKEPVCFQGKIAHKVLLQSIRNTAFVAQGNALYQQLHATSLTGDPAALPKAR